MVFTWQMFLHLASGGHILVRFETNPLISTSFMKINLEKYPILYYKLGVIMPQITACF